MKADAAVSLLARRLFSGRASSMQKKKTPVPGTSLRSGGKGKKQGQTGEISVSEASPSGGLGRGKVFPLPRLLLGPLRSPIFFSYFPECGAWSHANM